ncbi:N-methylhydantoinase B [Thiogranum longum]|uniref:N-methylhydantoinase B n=1 Tax=Thiogranum longum TaxID=1537524 RepID=A0A4R1HPA3_9GAMM|nr:hydantoinase B/oxoprolinase family protein [Thiogranum longum]TCK19112.1 N-methylhydantoinase B [Thiogranum longum]
MDSIELGLFASRLEAVCDEMGAMLQQAAFSPNIRDRLDYSCAVFDPGGELCAQAAHIPVHLGSMAYAMHDLVKCRAWREGDMLVVNDPYRGGTHLPDVTLVTPVFIRDSCVGFIANRAHHADIGADSPGSMPVGSTIEDEGLLIPPTLLVERGEVIRPVLDEIIAATHNPIVTEGDFSAQISANRTGVERVSALVSGSGVERWLSGLAEINRYGERMAREALSALPDGEYCFTDYMDDDGQGNRDIELRVRLTIHGDRIDVDFSGSAGQVEGNINCPLSVAAAAVFYVFRCLMDERTPACAGSFRSIHIHAPPGCLLNACAPAAVAAGNVETSSRVVDLVLGALAQVIPERVAAASQGTMNNLAMGSRLGSGWDYYETIGGGMGAGADGGGLNGVQTHMTNTLNTPIEVLESAYPLRIRRYALRNGSGGAGRVRGGDGLVREYEFLASAEVTLLTERRVHAPWGLAGGQPGAAGKNLLNGRPLEPKITCTVKAGDRLEIQSPGGGGYGEN